MRPADTVFSSRVSLPEWLAALRKQLGAGGDQAPPEHLGPVAALDELREVASAAVQGPGPPASKPDRVSLRADVQDAFSANTLGPALTKQLSSAWGELKKDIGRLPELLDSADGARVLFAAAHAMAETLGTPEASRAAWDDVVSAFKGGENAERCELRLLQLRELCERRGIEWQPFGLASRLRGIINDDPFELPGVATEDLDPQDLEERLAGVPQDERLAIAREVVGEEPATGEVIVWLAFENAWLDGCNRRLGPVEFFADDLWPESLREGNYPRNPSGEGPSELHDDDYEYHFEGLPEKDFVLARVTLASGHLAGATKRARQLVEEVVRLAEPGSQWRLMKGAAVYFHGHGWGGSPLMAADLFEGSRLSSPRYEPTSHALSELDGRLVEALANEEHAALDAIGYAKWWRAVAAIPELAQRIALSIRLLERALPRNAEAKNPAWAGAAKRYLREIWCEQQLGRWLQDATSGILAGHPGRMANTSYGVGQSYLALQEELNPPAGDMYFYFYADVALRRLPQLTEEVAQGSVERRLLDEVARRSQTGPDAAEWLAQFALRFDRLLARTVRQRNAVLHGTTTVPAVLKTVEPFVKELTANVVSEQLHAVITGSAPISNMEHLRYQAIERLARLRTGEPADQVLFQARRAEDVPHCDSAN